MVHKAVMNKVNRIKRTLNASLADDINDIVLEVYVDLVMELYDTELVGVVTDRRSRTNPVIYRDEFQEALENFDYIESDGNGNYINWPTMSNFPWRSGRLRIIQNILEGIIGVFMEVDEEQYIALLGTKPYIEPYDKTVTKKERIYLIKWNSKTLRKWRETFPKDPPVRYPFSNLPSVDIFTRPMEETKEVIMDMLPDIIRKKLKEMPR